MTGAAGGVESILTVWTTGAEAFPALSVAK